MEVYFNNLNRQHDILPRVVEALQRLQDNPDLLARERNRRYNQDPPPYPGSGETTDLDTPSVPVPAAPVAAPDEPYEREKRREAHYKSVPGIQFRSQAQREQARLEHQLSTARFGRRQTLPWDDSVDLRANAENNVRRRWVEQGIWGDEWGPAWPPGSSPMATGWPGTAGDGPFWGAFSCAASDARPGLRWGHEEYPDLDPEPERQEEEEGPGLASQQGNRPLFGHHPLLPRPPTKPSRPVKYVRTLLGRVPKTANPSPTVADPEASRPYEQFKYQIIQEKQWTRDEMFHQALMNQTPVPALNLDAEAYESVKDNWTKDGVWNPQWGDVPGPKWTHEDPCPEEEDLESSGASEGGVGEEEEGEEDEQEQEGFHEAADDGARQAGHRQTQPAFAWALFGLPTTGATTNGPGKPPMVGLRDAGASDGQTQSRGPAAEISNPQVDIARVVENLQQVALASAWLPQAEARETSSSAGWGASTAQPQSQLEPLTGRGATANAGGSRARPKRSRDDDHSDAGEPPKRQRLQGGRSQPPAEISAQSSAGQRKRERPGADGDERPSKRLKQVSQPSAGAGASDIAASDRPQCSVAKGTGRRHGGKAAASRGRSRRKTAEADPVPVRRSARIAERKAREASSAVEEPPKT